MDPTYFLALVCFFGPTPLAACLAGWQALQCPSPWQAFAVGLVGTVALAVVFGVAADYLPLWGVGWSFGFNRVWQLHLAISPFVGVPVGTYCAVVVQRRRTPPTE